MAAGQGIPAANGELRKLREPQRARAISTPDAVIGRPGRSEPEEGTRRAFVPHQSRSGITPDAGRSAAPERSSVGRTLRQARIAAGLTCDDVSTTTRVRRCLVHAIERDDFAPCGGDFYARGHIRALARAVRLDPEPLLARFTADHGGQPGSNAPAALLSPAERIRAGRREPRWTAALVAAVVAVTGFIGYTVLDGDAGGTRAAVGPTTTTSRPAPATRKTERPGTGSAPRPTGRATAAAARDRVTVQVSADRDRSWISAEDHAGRPLWSGLLERGDSRTFQDSERIGLVLGNAGAVELYVDGKRTGHRFPPGQVERLTFAKDHPND
ncbi:helix-turn-helix domain-containing protein [Streptomyces phaeofaciens]